MPRVYFQAAGLISALLLCVPAFGKEQRAVCPKRYPSAETRLPITPNGWVGYGNLSSGLRLSGGGMIIGRPEDRGELRGHDRKTKDGYEIVFASLQNFEDLLQKWVYCGYGFGGEVQLLNRVDISTNQCTLKFIHARDPSVPDVEFNCD
jgi:hypothetical protein